MILQATNMIQLLTLGEKEGEKGGISSRISKNLNGSKKKQKINKAKSIPGHKK